MAEWINEDILSANYVRNFIPDYVSPLILIICNSLIIPLLVDLVAYLEDHETNSGKQITTMILNFVFMSINVIFIPLTNYITMREFLDFVIQAL